MAGSLTAGQMTEPGSQLPFLIVFLAFSTWLLPRLCAGEYGGNRTLVLLIVRLVALYTVIALVPRVLDGLAFVAMLQVDPAGLGRLVDWWVYGLVGAGGGVLPPLAGVEVSWLDLVLLHVVRPILYYALLLPPLLVGLLWLDARLKQRALRWYALGPRVKRAFFGSTAVLAAAGWLLILPLLNHIVFPEVYPTVSPSEALGAVLALGGGAAALVAFWRTDRRRRGRCPACSATLEGPHRLGATCGACGTELHGWLVARYGDGEAAP